MFTEDTVSSQGSPKGGFTFGLSWLLAGPSSLQLVGLRASFLTGSRPEGPSVLCHTGLSHMAIALSKPAEEGISCQDSTIVIEKTSHHLGHT